MIRFLPTNLWLRITLGALLVIVVAAGVPLVWLFTADLGVLKPQLLARATEALGRPVSVDGPLHIHLGHNEVEVSAEGLRIAGADWSPDTELLAVERLATRFDPWSLLSGPIRIHSVEIAGTRVRLTKNEQGQRNWDLDLAADPDDPDSPGLDLLLQSLTMDDVQVVYQDPARPRPIDLRIDSLRQRREPDDQIAVSVDATLNDRPLTLEGRGGPWSAMLAGRDIDFDLEGRIDSIELTTRGRIDSLEQPRLPGFEFSLKGPRVSDLSAMLGLGEVGDGDIQLGGALRGDGPLELEFAGNLGASRIAVTSRFNALDDFEHVDLDAAANGPDLGRILAYFDILGVDASPFDAKIELQREGQDIVVEKASMTFGDAQLEAKAHIPSFPGFEKAAVQVEVRGRDLGRLRRLLQLPGKASGPYTSRIDISTDAAGKPSLDATLEASLGRLEVRGPIGDAPDYHGTRFDFEFRVHSLKTIGQLADLPPLPDQSASISGAAQLDAEGIELKSPLALKTEGLKATLSGRLGDPPNLSKARIDFEVEGPNLRDVAKRFGLDADLPPRPYKASGELTRPTEGYALKSVKATIGRSRLELDGLVGDAADRSGSRLDFTLRGPAIEELFSEVDGIHPVPGEFQLDGKIRLDPNELVVERLHLKRPAGAIDLDAKLPWPLDTKKIELSAHAKGTDLNAMLGTIAGFEPAAAPFSVDIEARRDNDRWSLDPFTARFADASLNARGTLDLVADRISGDLSIAGDIPDPAKLGRHERRRLSAQPIRFNASLSGEKDRLVGKDIQIQIGDSHLVAQLKVRPAAVPDIEIELSSPRLVLNPFFEPSNSPQPDPKSPPNGSDERLIPDVDIPIESLRMANAELSLRLGALHSGEDSAKNVELHGSLRDAKLNIDRFSVETRGGTFDGKLFIGAKGDTAQVRTKLKGRSLALAASPKGEPTESDIDVDIEATGANTRQLAASANGVVVFQATGGQLENYFLANAFYGSVFSEILSLINPRLKTEKYTHLECFVLPLEIRKGQAQTKPRAYAQTDKIRLLGTGDVRLETERIDVNLRSTPRNKLQVSLGEILNPYIKIVGTLANPRPTIDEKGVLIAGGAAIATTGISILAKGVWDRVSEPANACAEAEQEASKLLPPTASAPPQSPTPPSDGP